SGRVQRRLRGELVGDRAFPVVGEPAVILGVELGAEGDRHGGAGYERLRRAAQAFGIAGLRCTSSEAQPRAEHRRNDETDGGAFVEPVPAICQTFHRLLVLLCSSGGGWFRASCGCAASTHPPRR